MRSLALLVIVSILACAATNRQKNESGLAENVGHFQVNQSGNTVVASGCFSTVEALGRETQKIFTQFVEAKCLARYFMEDGKLKVEERIVAGGKLYCTMVVYSIDDCADKRRAK
jgi:hypothetical protein